MNQSLSNRVPQDTIVAIATPPGQGGVGMIRLSGVDAKHIAEIITHSSLKPRYAHYVSFYDEKKSVLDQGLALLFIAPYSFTGETVVELHAHGSPIVLDLLVRRCVELGARLARPGEFSERAFLNQKMDLTQAEAVADLIASGSEQAARSALKSLQGEFSQSIHQLVEALIQLRIYVEAAIDFPEEEIDFLSDEKVQSQLKKIISDLKTIQKNAKQGSLLREGMTVVIAGKPNAGKSSLLNALSQRNSAIVSQQAGTTRDILREYIQLDGLPLHIVDTAGLRDSGDDIEQEGIRRAHEAMKTADEILLIHDATKPFDKTFLQELAKALDVTEDAITLIYNKVDLPCDQLDQGVLKISAKTGEGLDALKNHLKQKAGYVSEDAGVFLARRRHCDALHRAFTHVLHGEKILHEQHAGELLAEELRLAQVALNEITGEFTSDDLLGKIFSSFCIGK